MTEKQAVAVALSYLNGGNSRIVGQILGISAGAAWNRAHPTVVRRSKKRHMQTEHARRTRAASRQGRDQRGVKKPRIRIPEDPVKRRARYLVRQAIKHGDLSRPDVCPECGDDERQVQAHHEDYARPLDVEWCCQPCHQKRHRIYVFEEAA